jgi:succinyl-CoA synthetase beta subunit
LEGTNVDQGKQILRESGLKITPADGLADAAKKAVEAARAAGTGAAAAPGWEI